ncbi:MAG: LPS export ABC transporter periplasmic protein LptC, partial [Prolixibacteraceae bacterium]|nr:LPS export ABC transporter periplasmic protein LptC [Prolixibacteraceae bacterium]
MLLSDETVVENAKRLVGNVILSHNNMIMKCDSAWAYTTTNSVDAFGNVHIISNDTLNLWAEFINYNGNTSFAYARKNVKLEDPSLTLFTDSLDFDMNEEIGYYNFGGKIIDSTNVLNSKIGRYYSKTSTVHFIENVRLKNEDYTLRTDTLLYNTNTEIVSFDGPTRIIGDSTNIYSTLGWFNTKTQESELNENSTIRRGETQLQGDYIHYNDANKEGIAKGNVVINDYEKQMIIAGNNAIYDDFDQYAIVTDSAMWVQYYEDDSLFLHADTLYTIPDTSMAGQKMLIAYNNVRFFRSDMQGISDSLIYFSKDSTIQLFSDPVIWWYVLLLWGVFFVLWLFGVG